MAMSPTLSGMGPAGPRAQSGIKVNFLIYIFLVKICLAKTFFVAIFLAVIFCLHARWIGGNYELGRIEMRPQPVASSPPSDWSKDKIWEAYLDVWKDRDEQEHRAGKAERELLIGKQEGRQGGLEEAAKMAEDAQLPDLASAIRALKTWPEPSRKDSASQEKEKRK
jgi:hypothetical protein